jgi:hypothetical protein
MRNHEILAQQRVIGRPFCELCKSQMWLACIEPDEPGHDGRTFECRGCPNIAVRIVKYRATEPSPPSQLDAWYPTWQRPLPNWSACSRSSGSPHRRQIATGRGQHLDAAIRARLPISLSFAIAAMSAFGPYRHQLLHGTCRLLTQSGHRAS